MTRGPDAPAPRRAALALLGPPGPARTALATILTLLGCAPPGGTTARDGRPAGGQSDALAALNAGLLSAGPASPDVVRRVREVVGAEFGPDGPLLLDDLALVQVLPTWADALAGAGIDLLVVCVHQSPPAGLPATGEPGDALRQALDAERASRGFRRAFVGAERLRADWGGTLRDLAQRLGGEPWPVPASDPTAAPAIEAVLERLAAGPRSDLAGAADVPADERRAWDVLDAWAAEGEDAADRPILDRARAALDGPAAPRSVESDVAAWEAALGHARAELRAATEGWAATRSALAQRGLEAEEEGQARRRLEAALASLEAELEGEAKARRRLEAALARSRRDVAILKADGVRALHARFLAALGPADGAAPGEREGPPRHPAPSGPAEAELEAARQRAQALEARLAQVEAGLSAVLASTSWRVTAPIRRLLGALRRDRG